MQKADANFSQKFVSKQNLTVYGQLSNGAQVSHNIAYNAFAHFAGKTAPITLNYDEEKTLDKNHSHFLLLDNGRVDCYIDDRPRSDFVKDVCAEFQCQAITIIVEGGFNTLEVIKHDLMAKRPVIIIHGSGRLANVLGTLLETSNKGTIPKENDVKEQLESAFHEHWSKLKKDKEKDAMDIIDSIRKLFEPEQREHLSVFYLERDPSLTDTIFKAVDTAQTNAEQQEIFLKLAISWNYVGRAESMPKRFEDSPKLFCSLFEQALKENRPVFVDYFLRQNHNPVQTTEYLKRSESLKKAISSGNESDSDLNTSQSEKKLSENETNSEEKILVECALKFVTDDLYQSVQTHIDHWSTPKTSKELDAKYTQLIGPFVNSFYFEQKTGSQLLQDIKAFVYRDGMHEIDGKSPKENDRKESYATNTCNKPFSSQEMFRELFLWSVYVGYADIAFVLLLQLESRVGAALIAAGMAQHLSLFAGTLDVRHAYNEQAKDYETYATDCINACYRHNERLACQLLLRENPLFGNITCMQLAVDYYTRMLERWHRPGIWMIPIYAMPYILFYIGIILYFRSENRLDLFTDARIILAIDLELWYLFSLRFVSAIKLLGPKLFMIRNMLRYLTGFMYIIFVCIAAYGVVSRALTMYDELEFTARSVLTAIFYQPYWFLYSIVDQEKSHLDDIISNGTSSEAVAEATVTHVLLAFHMLFINILILNLLIAVFNFTINEVQDKNEYIWRYQKYELIREYFEKPLFTFPPLSLLAYIGWIINAVIFQGTTFRVF
ncbi:unnamed protein product, partial [Rotaria sp. Silwood2]